VALAVTGALVLEAGLDLPLVLPEKLRRRAGFERASCFQVERAVRGFEQPAAQGRRQDAPRSTACGGQKRRARSGRDGI